MLRRSLIWVAMSALLLCTLTGTALAITVNARFLETGAQIFPVGELVSIEDIEAGEDIDLGTLPRLFEITIRSTIEPDDIKAILDVELRASGSTLVKFVSTPFFLQDWETSPYGSNGEYDNIQLSELQEDGTIMGENSDESYYATTSEFLDLLDGSNLSAGLYTLSVFVYEADENGNRVGLLGQYTQNTQVYNPAPPQLQSPDDGEEINGYPIFFTWNWYGGPVMPTDVTLIIVEGLPGEDGETVIASRNAANTRFEGSPQIQDSHTYTGFSGEEQGLTPDATYYWMVRYNISTIIPGSPREFDSNVYSFKFAANDPNSDPVTPSGGDGTDQGGNDPLLDQLSAILPSEVMQGLYDNLQGFSYNSITIDGVSGYNQQDLLRLLNNTSTTVVTVGIED